MSFLKTLGNIGLVLSILIFFVTLWLKTILLLKEGNFFGFINQKGQFVGTFLFLAFAVTITAVSIIALIKGVWSLFTEKKKK